DRLMRSQGHADEDALDRTRCAPAVTTERRGDAESPKPDLPGQPSFFGSDPARGVGSAEPIDPDRAGRDLRERAGGAAAGAPAADPLSGLPPGGGQQLRPGPGQLPRPGPPR